MTGPGVQQPPLVVIAGITGTGKSALSLDLAEARIAAGQPAEIVNADSLQLYRGMDIGTAKVPSAERRGIPHHLLDVLEVTETATVAQYQSTARSVIAALRGRGVLPILVGGSGLYLRAVVSDLEFPGSSAELRELLESELAAEGPEQLWRRLRREDPVAAERIEHTNSRRVIRALEVITLTGRPYAAALPSQPRDAVPTVQFFLDGDRERLKQRLRDRAEGIWSGGLLEETRDLVGRGLRLGQTARQAIGYAQALAVLDGTLSYSDAVADTIAATWRYARRQRSWFARYRFLHRLDWERDDLLETVQGVVNGKYDGPHGGD